MYPTHIRGHLENGLSRSEFADQLKITLAVAACFAQPDGSLQTKCGRHLSISNCGSSSRLSTRTMFFVSMTLL